MDTKSTVRVDGVDDRLTIGIRTTLDLLRERIGDTNPKKGYGQGHCGDGVAAQSNAVHNADGVRLRSLPINLDKALSALS